MDKNGEIIRAIVSLCFIFLSPTGCAEETTPPSDTVTIVDGTGQSVDVSRPVMRIVSITSRTSEIICALGAGDTIVGRNSYSIFPPYLTDVPVVGKSSYSPNIELILELNPDVVIADTMLTGDNRERIETAGIPVIVQSVSDSSRTITVVSNFGLILDKEERVGEIISFIEQYQDIIEEQITNLEPEDKPSVFFERGSAYHTASSGTSFHKHITNAGGINIASAEPVRCPTVCPEWVVERNPVIIVRTSWVTTSEGLTTESLKEVRDEIFSQPGLSEVKAVKDGRVYIINNCLLTGVNSIIGELYFAKWFHPNLFEDIDPEAVHRELVQKFYGLELEGVYVYP